MLYIEKRLKKINNLIGEKNYDEANELLEEISNNYGNLEKKYNVIILFLKGKLLEEKTKDYEFYETLEYGHLYADRESIDQALFYYEQGFKKTNNSLFIYYIAKLFYKVKDYTRALEYFRIYISMGGSKLGKAYSYLSRIFQRYPYNFQGISKKYEELCDIVNDFEGLEIEYGNILELKNK